MSVGIDTRVPDLQRQITELRERVESLIERVKILEGDDPY